MTPQGPSSALQDFITFLKCGLSGRIPVLQLIGSFATPLASFTGAAAGLIAVPTPLKIPAGYINPNSTVVIEALVKRVGVGGTANLDVRLGTLNTASDSAVLTIAQAATTNLVTKVRAEAKFGALATSFYTPGLVALNAAGAALGSDQASNVNTQADMWVNIGVSSANAGDSFGLLAVNVFIEQ